MKKRFTFLIAAVMLLTMINLPVNAVGQKTDPTVLFHETFGEGSTKARNWSDTYSVKSGVAAVYENISAYSMTNLKQSNKNSGSSGSGGGAGLIQTTGAIANFVSGPYNVSNYVNLNVTYDWKAASINNNTYYTKLYYKTSSSATTWIEVTGGSGNGATSYVQRSYSLPSACQVETLYLKVTFYTSNTQAFIDEFEITGTASGGGSTPTAVAPEFNPTGGAVIVGSTVTMSTTTDGGVIHYTTDGNAPDANSATYTSPVAVNADMTIKAITIADGYNNSSVTTGTYKIVQHAGTEVDPYTIADARIAIDAANGQTLNDKYVTGIVSQVDGINSYAITYWISDDGTTTDQFEVYKGKSFNAANFSDVSDIQVGDVVVVHGNITYYSNSSVYEFASGSSITSLKLVAPTIYPASSAVGSGTEVTLSTLRTGASFYYTTDGSDPTTSSTQYNANSKPTITAATTFKAIAVKSGCTNSDVANASYTILTPVATPEITLAGGTYTFAQTTTITCGTVGATIYYTTNGSNPTTSSTPYTGAISINESMTIKAIAAMDGMANSAVAMATYTITLPVINASNINLACDATSGSIPYTITNPDDGTLTAAITAGNEGTWLSLGTVNGTTVPLNCSVNEGNADRTATVTLTYTYSGDHSVTKDVTVTQAHYVKDYADLPFEWDDTSTPTGITNSGVGTYTSSPYLKFDTQGDYIILKINETPGTLTFDLKGNNLSGSYKFTVLESENGTDYTTLKEYSNIASNTTNETLYPAATTRYIKWIYTTKSNGNVALGNISLTKGVIVTFNGNGGTYNNGNTYTQKVSPYVATALEANHFERANFAFINWNTESNGTGTPYEDGESITITADLTLYAQWAPLYTATVANGIEHGSVGIEGVSGDPVSLSVPAGTTVTLTYEPEGGYFLNAWNVYYVENEQQVEVEVENNQFNMPAHDVTVSATFTLPTMVEYVYSINGALGEATEEEQGETITLADGSDLDETFEFVGWTTNPNDVNNILDAGSEYTILNDVTFYAVYSKTVSVTESKVVILDGNELDSDDVTTGDTEYENNGFSYIISAGAKQISSSGDNKFTAKAIFIGKSGTYIYNTETFGDGITKFEIYANKGASAKVSVGINFSTSEIDAYNAEADNTWTATLSTLDNVYDASSALPTGAKYFWYQVTNANNSQVEFRITYEETVDVTTKYTRVFPTNTPVSAPITINGPTIIESGTVLDMGSYALTCNDASKLIIEDGGVLVTKSSGVKATVKKNVTAAAEWGEQDPEDPYTPNGWYFIASPVNGAAFPTGTTNTQDLYMLDWANNNWINLQNSGHSSVLTAGFQRGKGYLYASKAGNTLSVAGEIQPLDNENKATVTLAVDGWNLIGNPLTCKVTVSCGFDELNGAASTTTKESGSVINPFQGIAVYGDAGDEVTFTKAASQNAAAPSNNSLQMTLSQTVTTRGVESSKVIDNAVVSFSNNSGMPKFNMLGGNAKLYIPQNGEDYAIAFSNRQGDMPLNFKTTEAGMYTISFEGDNMDLKGVCLIDMLAEEKIDLSVDPSYTFIGSPADKAERFKIVFSPSTGSGADIFAYQSGSDIIVSGEGELQIFDVMGRRVMTQYISGVQTVNVNAQGVYIMKLNEKTQKIIVR